MNIQGKVHEVGGTIQVSDKFQKRELIVVVAENPEYPEYIKVEFTGDKVDLLDDVNAGDEVDVAVNLRGRPWTNKEGVTTYFNSIVGWKIEVTEANGQDDEDEMPF